jgi:hypothetical protein
MDNGLIFPYPRKSAHDEAGDANRPNRIVPSGVVRGARDPIR